MDWFLYGKDLHHERVKWISFKPLTLSCIMLKDCQTYLKSRGVNIVNFKNMFDHFPTLCIKELQPVQLQFFITTMKIDLTL